MRERTGRQGVRNCVSGQSAELTMRHPHQLKLQRNPAALALPRSAHFRLMQRAINGDASVPASALRPKQGLVASPVQHHHDVASKQPVAQRIVKEPPLESGVCAAMALAGPGARIGDTEWLLSLVPHRHLVLTIQIGCASDASIAAVRSARLPSVAARMTCWWRPLTRLRPRWCPNCRPRRRPTAVPAPASFAPLRRGSPAPSPV